MSQTESTMKTQDSTAKRFHISMLVAQFMKFFASSNHMNQDEQRRKKLMKLPSISVTTPDGDTTVVE